MLKRGLYITCSQILFPLPGRAICAPCRYLPGARLLEIARRGSPLLARAFKKATDGLVSAAYPQQCRLCASSVESFDDGVACHTCWLDTLVTQLITGPVCVKCGIPLPALASEGGAQYCGQCDSFPFSAARSCGIYSGAIEASILDLKSQPRICRRLRDIILRVGMVESASLFADKIVPVPLHSSRERERGFNQARLIAGVIARAGSLPICDRAIVRTRPTERHRAGLDAADRAKSVERAFKVVRPEDIIKASILLVDDVFTTGSTISAAAKTLLDAGAASVTVLTIARVAQKQIRLF